MARTRISHERTSGRTETMQMVRQIAQQKFTFTLSGWFSPNWAFTISVINAYLKLLTEFLLLVPIILVNHLGLASNNYTGKQHSPRAKRRMVQRQLLLSEKSGSALIVNKEPSINYSTLGAVFYLFAYSCCFMTDSAGLPRKNWNKNDITLWISSATLCINASNKWDSYTHTWNSKISKGTENGMVYNRTTTLNWMSLQQR